MNDATYTPKASRCKVYTWLKINANFMLDIMRTNLSKVVDFTIKNIKTRKKKKINRISRKSSYAIRACTAMAMTTSIKANARVSTFDSDSSSIGIDNRCSACISHVPEDFIGTL